MYVCMNVCLKLEEEKLGFYVVCVCASALHASFLPIILLLETESSRKGK